MDNDIQLFFIGPRINRRTSLWAPWMANITEMKKKKDRETGRNRIKKFYFRDSLFPSGHVENCEMYIRGIVTHAIGHSLSIWATSSFKLPKLISSFVARCNFVMYLALPLWHVIPRLPAAKLETDAMHTVHRSTTSLRHAFKLNRKRLFDLALL